MQVIELSHLSPDELRICNALYTGFKQDGTAKHDCSSCGLPLRTRRSLGCPVSGYRGQGYKGRECDGWLINHPLAHDMQRLWYLRGNVHNIFDEPNTLNELYFHRETQERRIQKIREMNDAR